MPLSRAALTQRVLKRPLHDDDRSIDNLVYQVRRKLHPHGGEALLTTVRNQGYASAIPLVRD
jgi:DNA-binding response OmpR family regulator